MKYCMQYSLLYSIQYRIYCHHPKQPVNLPGCFSYDWLCYHIQTPASKLFFWTVQHNLCCCTCSLDTYQRSPETLDSHWFMASVIACLSLQHHGSPFYPPYSHREAYPGYGNSKVHGVCTVALANPPTLDSVYQDKSTLQHSELYSKAL
jgi:hypothetical protein